MALVGIELETIVSEPDALILILGEGCTQSYCTHNE